jgi:hypothetical protein
MTQDREYEEKLEMLGSHRLVDLDTWDVGIIEFWNNDFGCGFDLFGSVVRTMTWKVACLRNKYLG